MTGILYVVTNKINRKQYVGKTYMELHKRIAIHIQDSKRYPNRPLYRAINKYGEENFIYTEVGRYEEGQLEKEEIWLIEKLDTYKNGYNATLGGDGKRYFEYSDREVIDLYNNLGQVNLVCEKLETTWDTVNAVLTKNNIKIKTSQEMQRKGVVLVEKSLQFKSLSDATQYLIESNKTTSTKKKYYFKNNKVN